MRVERRSTILWMAFCVAAALPIGCGGREGEGEPAAGGEPAVAEPAAADATAPSGGEGAAAGGGGGDCPAATRIEAADLSADWTASGPRVLDDVETAVARWNGEPGKDLQVVIASVPLEGTARTFEWLDPPVSGQDWVLRLKFFDSAGTVDAGPGYQPAVMPYPPRRMQVDVGFAMADGTLRRSLPDFRQGTAEITTLTADRVCGRFEFTGKEGAGARLEGEFVAPIQ